MALNSIYEKERLVMKLLEEGKNFQEIAKEAHVSFTFISRVKKKMLGDDTSVNKTIINTNASFKVIFGR